MEPPAAIAISEHSYNVLNPPGEFGNLGLSKQFKNVASTTCIFLLASYLFSSKILNGGHYGNQYPVNTNSPPPAVVSELCLSIDIILGGKSHGWTF